MAVFPKFSLSTDAQRNVFLVFSSVQSLRRVSNYRPYSHSVFLFSIYKELK